jgi:hypothetical protein
MGLDMYAFRVRQDLAVNDFEIDRDQEGDGVEEIAYWRKHHDLHGWMENLYRKRSGNHDGYFNCQPLRLTLEDLDNLETDIRHRKLPNTRGFFFGNNPPDHDSDYEDLQFVQRAREAITEGFEVYYDSWC